MFDLQTKVWLANEIRIWGLAVTAIIGVISFAATWTHSRLQAELSAQKEEIAARIQRESDERIAIAAKDAANANARAAEANQKAEEERLARVKIEQRLADRTLTDIDIADLIAKLTPFAGQTYKVTTFWDLKEPLNFANRLHESLQLSKWQYLEHGPGGSLLLGGLAGVQVYIHPRAEQKVIDAAHALVDILNTKDLNGQFKEQNAANPLDATIHINVGTKN